MKIKHYPGKAVANDPYLLDMDARNPAMDLLYEASWLDAQKSLSSSSSGSNSWDRTSTSSSEKHPVQLHKYTVDSSKNGSVRGSKRYHSDKYLSRIARSRIVDVKEEEPVQNYYLPSQTNYINRQHSFKTIDDLPNLNGLSINGKSTVSDDLDAQLAKKSVRFRDKSEEIRCDWGENEEDKGKRVRVVENPMDTEAFRSLYKIVKGEEGRRKDSEEAIAERVNEWINEQNQYIIGDVSDARRVGNNKPKSDTNGIEPAPPQDSPGIYTSRIKPHNQTDEEFYDKLVNSRQRLPAAKNGFSKPETHHYENEEVVSTQAKLLQNDLSDKDDSADPQGNDFLIPRPKLIVPVHTYAVRKRRTGNLQIETPAPQETTDGMPGER